MIWTAYIDETDTHGAPIMALGRFLSHDARWAEFGEAWKRLLLMYGPTNLRAGQGERHERPKRRLKARLYLQQG
jgi:hypothetical protein